MFERMNAVIMHYIKQNSYIYFISVENINIHIIIDNKLDQFSILKTTRIIIAFSVTGFI